MSDSIKTSSILITEPSKDYELLDSGEGEKLERFGDVVLSRPDPQALWHKKLGEDEWKKADGYFTRDGSDGKWAMKNGKLDRWSIEFGGLKLWVKPSAFKHVGIFPEQAANWEWLKTLIATRVSPSSRPAKLASVSSLSLKADGRSDSSRTHEGDTLVAPRILNLFGYTGGATLVCAQSGANVVHVDSSKTAMTSARDNAELSGLKDKPVRWILDDAREFVRRELKRGNKYDGIIMDPPAFGHGPDSELWKIEEHFLPLVDQCIELLTPKPLFFLINGYSAGYSATAYENILLPLIEKFGETIEIGELAIREVGSKERENGQKGRLLPAGIFARWCAN
jgi:23S rRNA (cytosine1962-C5)-methyltransferase